MLALLLLVLCGAFPDFDILIDLEEWLVNHLPTPLAVCFATGLMAVFVLAADIWWAIRLTIALLWLATLFAPLPSGPVTAHLAFWLTTHTYDSFLTAFTVGLSVATLASPGLWRSLFTKARATPKPHQTVAAQHAPAVPIEPWSAISGPEAPATEEAEETAKPEPWDIAPTVTIDTGIVIAEPVAEPIFALPAEETHPEQLPSAPQAETTITTPLAKEIPSPAAEPWDVAPTVATDSTVQTGLPPVAETASSHETEDVHTESLPVTSAESTVSAKAETTVEPWDLTPTETTDTETAAVVSPVESTIHLQATETRPEHVPALAPAPQPVAAPVEEIRSEHVPTPAQAETTIHTPAVKAETAPEPWDIAPTVAVETAVQTGLIPVQEAGIPAAAAEARTEILPVPPVESVLPLRTAQETVVPEIPAPTKAEATIHIPSAQVEITPEPWELAPTVPTETAADVSVSLVESTVPLLAPEPRAEQIHVEEIPSEQLPTPVQAETTIHTPEAPQPISAEPWELPPTVSPEDETRSEDAVAEAIPEDNSGPEATEIQTEIAETTIPAAAVTEEDSPATAAVQTEEKDSPVDAVQADEAAPPAQMPEEDDTSVNVVETETLPDATAITDEEEQPAPSVETDLPTPDMIGDADVQDFTAAFATIAAGNDSDALQVVAYDIEPLPEPTLQPDMPPPAPANYAYWDNQTHFQTWQAAWLWHDWEPRTEDPAGPPCTARILRLEDHLEKNMIRQVVPHKDGWMYAELPRQSLIDYAVACSERPKFLFPEERSWVSSRLRSLQGRDVPLHALTGYMPYNEVKLALYKILRSINSEAVATEVRAAMRKGLCDGVARRISGTITYGYERIPRMMWRRLKIDWLGNVSGGGHRYSGLMVRFRDGYLDTPQAEPPSAVEAYGAIDSYLREQDDTSRR